ncbi:hypothetical protein L1887_62861 [Cichorium endivia]|nr:hypothetical protein L1887_62861 [Cichorium endivia]
MRGAGTLTVACGGVTESHVGRLQHGGADAGILPRPCEEDRHCHPQLGSPPPTGLQRSTTHCIPLASHVVALHHHARCAVARQGANGAARLSVALHQRGLELAARFPHPHGPAAWAAAQQDAARLGGVARALMAVVHPHRDHAFRACIRRRACWDLVRPHIVDRHNVGGKSGPQLMGHRHAGVFHRGPHPGGVVQGMAVAACGQACGQAKARHTRGHHVCAAPRVAHGAAQAGCGQRDHLYAVLRDLGGGPRKELTWQELRWVHHAVRARHLVPLVHLQLGIAAVVDARLPGAHPRNVCGCRSARQPEAQSSGGARIAVAASRSFGGGRGLGRQLQRVWHAYWTRLPAHLCAAHHRKGERAAQREQRHGRPEEGWYCGDHRSVCVHAAGVAAARAVWVFDAPLARLAAGFDDRKHDNERGPPSCLPCHQLRRGHPRATREHLDRIARIHQGSRRARLAARRAGLVRHRLCWIWLSSAVVSNRGCAAGGPGAPHHPQELARPRFVALQLF